MRHFPWVSSFFSRFFNFYIGAMSRGCGLYHTSLRSDVTGVSRGFYQASTSDIYKSTSNEDSLLQAFQKREKEREGNERESETRRERGRGRGREIDRSK